MQVLNASHINYFFKKSPGSIKKKTKPCCLTVKKWACTQNFVI